MFQPINLPPSDHHQFATGHSTEYGDNAKTVGEKINNGFKHVYDVLRGLGATLADEVEYVAKTDFDALVHELDETKAELRNIKMVVDGYFVSRASTTALDGSHSMTLTERSLSSLDPDGKPATGGTPTPSAEVSAEPVVTVKPVGEPDSTMIVGKLEGSEPTVKVTEL